MHYYTLGNTGLKVSRLALGTMTFGDDWGWGANEAESRAIFQHFMEAGGNFFDTADLYTNGNSERMLGKFIKETGSRDFAVITSKFSYNAEPGNPNAGGNSRKNIMRAVEGSLQRLGTDYLDVYMLHTWDRFTPAEEVMRTMDDLVRSGKVRYVGLSDVPAWYASEAQTLATERGYAPISTLQLEYSLVERNIEHEFVPLARNMGMGVMAWSPLASGLLSGKYRADENGVVGEGRLAAMAGSGNPAFEKFTPENFQVVATLQRVADKLGYSMAQLALHWVVTQPGIASVLVGASKLSQLQDNLAALNLEVPAEAMAELDAASQPDRPFPYAFFGDEIQSMITGNTHVSAKPAGYYTPNTVTPVMTDLGAS